MTEDGKPHSFTLGGKERRGKEFLDYADAAARQAYYLKPSTADAHDHAVSRSKPT